MRMMVPFSDIVKMGVLKTSGVEEGECVGGVGIPSEEF